MNLVSSAEKHSVDTVEFLNIVVFLIDSSHFSWRSVHRFNPSSSPSFLIQISLLKVVCLSACFLIASSCENPLANQYSKHIELFSGLRFSLAFLLDSIICSLEKFDFSDQGLSFPPC